MLFVCKLVAMKCCPQRSNFAKLGKNMLITTMTLSVTEILTLTFPPMDSITMKISG